MKKVTVIIFFIGLIINSSHADTLSCSYLNTFESDRIMTFFFKRDNNDFRYHVDGKLKRVFELIEESDRKIIIAHFSTEFDSFFIFDKESKLFKIVSIYLVFGKQDKSISGKCEMIK